MSDTLEWWLSALSYNRRSGEMKKRIGKPFKVSVLASEHLLFDLLFILAAVDELRLALAITHSTRRQDGATRHFLSGSDIWKACSPGLLYHNGQNFRDFFLAISCAENIPKSVLWPLHGDHKICRYWSKYECVCPATSSLRFSTV